MLYILTMLLTDLPDELLTKIESDVGLKCQRCSGPIRLNAIKAGLPHHIYSYWRHDYWWCSTRCYRDWRRPYYYQTKVSVLN